MHYAERIGSVRLCAGSAERVGQGEVGEVTGRVLSTWQLLGLAVKGPWLALANSHLGCTSRLRKHYSHRLGGLLLAGKASWALSGCLPTKSACSFNEWVWLRSQVRLLRLKVHFGSFLESELGQK